MGPAGDALATGPGRWKTDADKTAAMVSAVMRRVGAVDDILPACNTGVPSPWRSEHVFNLGYYTWVERQNIALADFDRRRDQSFWDGLMSLVPVWDQMIEELNPS